MTKKTERPAPHPDDFLAVTICLDFQAKLNSGVDDPMPFDSTGLQYTLPAAEAADYLEKVVSAIRERRLYGFMVQENAECAVGAGDWVAKTTEELLAEARAENVDVRLPNAQKAEL
jgi:hypothetical protein